MITGARNKSGRALSAREAYVAEKLRKGFTPTEILTLLQRDGFQPVVRSRVYQIAEENGIKIKTQ